jgi:hypothetical protein
MAGSSVDVGDLRVDGAGFLAAAASAECPMSTTILPVWLKDLIFFQCAAAADAGLWCCKTGLRGSAAVYKSKQHSGGQNNNHNNNNCGR